MEDVPPEICVLASQYNIVPNNDNCNEAEGKQSDVKVSPIALTEGESDYI